MLKTKNLSTQAPSQAKRHVLEGGDCATEAMRAPYLHCPSKFRSLVRVLDTYVDAEARIHLEEEPFPLQSSSQYNFRRPSLIYHQRPDAVLPWGTNNVL